MITVDGTAETSSFAENIGPRPNSPGRNFSNKLLPVSYTHLDVYKRQVLDVITVVAIREPLSAEVFTVFRVVFTPCLELFFLKFSAKSKYYGFVEINITVVKFD